MPLCFDTQTQHTHIYVWRIDEDERTLGERVWLSENGVNKLQRLKKVAHRKSFFASRILLNLAGYEDRDISYQPSGKPTLSDGKHISISHTNEFVTLAISDQMIGVDIEKSTEKMLRVYPKFIDQEAEYLAPTTNHLERIGIVWCAKEAVYKAANAPGLPLKNIHVLPFDTNESPQRASYAMRNLSKEFVQLFYWKIDHHHLVLAEKTNS